MPLPTYKEPTTAEAYKDPLYTQQAGLYDQSANAKAQGLNEQLGYTQTSYARQRQDLLNSYQSSLDQINLGLKEAGIQSRSQYAGRNLYDASGDVSGIGQGVGAQNVAPYLGQIKNLQTAQASALSGLGEQERADVGKIRSQIAQIPLITQQQKYDLLNQILGNLRTQREGQYNRGVDQYKETTRIKERAEELPTSKRNLDLEQQRLGRRYIPTPAERDAYLRQGGHIVVVNGRVYALSPQEEMELANQQSLIQQRNAPSGSGGGGKGTTTDKYSVTGNDVGGLSFTRNGQPVGAFVYAQSKGKTLMDVLKGSKDQGDIELLRDIQDLMDAGASYEEIINDLRQEKPWLFDE